MPPPEVGKKKRDEPVTITVIVDGTKHTVRVDEINARDAVGLRHSTGMSLQALMTAAGEDPDLDVIAAFVWLARRQDGETTLSYDKVAEQITYGSTIDIADNETEDDGGGDVGEAPAANSGGSSPGS